MFDVMPATIRVQVENSHSSSGTICMQNRVEVGGTIRNYFELICCVTSVKTQCENLGNF